MWVVFTNSNLPILSVQRVSSIVLSFSCVTLTGVSILSLVGSGSFPDHQPLIPPVSEVQLNPATDEGDIGPQPPQTGVPAPVC